MQTTTTKKSAWKPWHGFAIVIGPDTDLGGDAFLVLEYKAGILAGTYEPIGGVSTINEAQEIASNRMQHMPGLDGTFKVWARGVDGRFLVVPVVIDGRRK